MSCTKKRTWTHFPSWLQLLNAEMSRWCLKNDEEYKFSADRLAKYHAANPCRANAALKTIDFARSGLIPFASTVQLVRATLQCNLSQRKRIAVARAFMDYLWERVGPVDEAVCLARRIVDSEISTDREKLRSAALLNASANKDEATEILFRINSRNPQLLRKIGYIELGALAARFDIVDKVHAEELLHLRERLTSSEGKFQSLVGSCENSFVAVANGPSVKNTQPTDPVDSRNLVIRFNNFPDVSAVTTKMGERTDVWIRSHDRAYVPLRRIDNLKHIVVSGCDCCNRFSNGFEHISKLFSLGVTVEVVPIPIYQKLFKQLDASPSVGIIALSWISDLLLRKLDAKEVLGFDLGLNTYNKTVYSEKTALGRRAGRHNWQAEHLLYQEIVESAYASS